MNQKGFSLIHILLVLMVSSIVVGIAYYFGVQKSYTGTPSNIVNNIQPSNTPKADTATYLNDSNRNEDTTKWKTYVNSEFGYSIKYPESIDETYYRSSVGSFVSILLTSVDTNDVSERNMNILDAPNNYKTFQESLDNHYNQSIMNATVTRNSYTLAGTSGEAFTQTYKNGVENYSIWIPRNNMILVFETRYKPENKEKALNQFNHILSTFKFTN